MYACEMLSFMDTKTFVSDLIVLFFFSCRFQIWRALQ